MTRLLIGINPSNKSFIILYADNKPLLLSEIEGVITESRYLQVCTMAIEI